MRFSNAIRRVHQKDSAKPSSFDTGTPPISFEETIRRLKRGAPLSDSAFDQVYPSSTQSLSRTHFTPVQVALRAVALLKASDQDRVLDVGSGVGKFCLIAGIATQAHYHGIEQRKHFVDLAKSIANRFRISRVSFEHGNMEALDWSRFSAVYLFNPFQENRTPEQKLDETIPLSRALYDRYVAIVLEKIAEMRPGTRIVTYHGFGGTFPQCYSREVSEWCYRGPLELWIKRGQV